MVPGLEFQINVLQNARGRVARPGQSGRSAEKVKQIKVRPTAKSLCCCGDLHALDNRRVACGVQIEVDE